jgi:hypothetical protein
MGVDPLQLAVGVAMDSAVKAYCITEGLNDAQGEWVVDRMMDHLWVEIRRATIAGDSSERRP